MDLTKCSLVSSVAGLFKQGNNALVMIRGSGPAAVTLSHWQSSVQMQGRCFKTGSLKAKCHFSL